MMGISVLGFVQNQINLKDYQVKNTRILSFSQLIISHIKGWDPDSYGYHGDDGYSFAGSGSGKPYGPCFTTGDIIGCGVNFADNTAFYTKNGSFLGNAFTNINTSKPIYPAIGLRTAGEEMATNFGNEPFVFDIEHYIHVSIVINHILLY